MKKLLIITALAAVCGCQTRITATKNAEVANPYYAVATENGTNRVYVAGYAVTSGGWEATARSPLWADEQLKGLTISVATNGTVSLGLDVYHRDLSTNAVTTTHILTDAAVNLAAKVALACASGGASTSTDVITAWISKFVNAGGDTSKATVTCANGSCTITDGTVTCKDGTCSE